MAASGKTPILLYGSTTATNAPVAGNLTNSSDGCEIAINVADKNLFFKDSTNTVNTVPIRQSSASSNGWLSSTDWSTFNGKAPSFTYTSGYIPYGQGTTTPTQSSSLTFDGTVLGVGTSNPSGFATRAGFLNGTVMCAASSTSNTAYFGVQNDLNYSGGMSLRPSNYSTYGAITANCLNFYYGSGNIAITADGGNDVLIGAGNNVPTCLQISGSGSQNVTVNAGNLVIGTSGKGIDFSATPGTGTSELLADYEEGTWTPTFTYETPGDLSVSYAQRTGTYTKVGRLVTVSWYVQLSAYSQTTASGALSISGLPYSINAALAVQGGRGEAFFYNTITKAGYTDFSWIANGSTTLSLYAIGSGVAGATVTVANVTAGTHAYSGTYTYEV